jgi:DNA-binding SARP family transcriptional activator
MHVLGAAAVACGGRQIHGRLPSSTLVLLAALALRPGWAQRRDELAFTLWPDRTERDARANLRRHLYTLQNELPASVAAQLACTTKTVTWHAGDAWVDANEFSSRAATDEVEAAVYLYGGSFLPRIDHEWVNERREAFHRAYCIALEAAIARRTAAGDAVGTLRHVEALFAADPWREDMLRSLRLLRARIGDRAGALAAYQTFRARLFAELAVHPMPETIATRDAIISGTSLDGRLGVPDQKKDDDRQGMDDVSCVHVTPSLRKMVMSGSSKTSDIAAYAKRILLVAPA